MKKLGIVITDGVGFRNFVLSDFLTEAESQFDEVVILSCLPASVYEGFLQKSRVIELAVFEEKFQTWFFRKFKEVAHLQLHKKGNFGIADNLNSNKSKQKRLEGTPHDSFLGGQPYFIQKTGFNGIIDCSSSHLKTI